MSTQAIGIFDSGVGGTSIWKEIHELLPNEDCIYLADSKNAPYGPKGKDKIIKLCVKNTELLLGKDVKLIVVACNTATTNAIDYLRSHYSIPFIGIEPAIKPASLQTKTGAIGILATKGTLSSSLFYQTSALFTQDIKVIEQVGEGIVPLIERGELQSIELRMLLKKYLQPMIAANIDYLVLGCSHYPYLFTLLKDLLPENVTIIDSGEAVARQTQHILKENGLCNTQNIKPKLKFFSNGNPAVLKQLVGDSLDVDFLNF